jgi:serine/threonine protein kinase
LGIQRFLTHVSYECVDLITKLLAYNPDERLSAKQALSHPYFKDLVEQEAKMSKMSMNNFNPINLMKSFHNSNDSQSEIKR